MFSIYFRMAVGASCCLGLLGLRLQGCRTKVEGSKLGGVGREPEAYLADLWFIWELPKIRAPSTDPKLVSFYCKDTHEMDRNLQKQPSTYSLSDHTMWVLLAAIRKKPLRLIDVGHSPKKKPV